MLIEISSEEAYLIIQAIDCLWDEGGLNLTPETKDLIRRLKDVDPEKEMHTGYLLA